MKIAVFSAKPFDRRYFTEINKNFGHDLLFLGEPLRCETVPLVDGAQAVCPFVNDTVDRCVLEALKQAGISIVALRSAGFNNVDLKAAEELGITVVRVPAYSPYAVAEHAVAMIMTLNRKTHRAYNRVREGNFALEGLLGFDVHGKTVGIVGMGKIGEVFAHIMKDGFRCRVLAYDPHPEARDAEGVEFVPLEEVFRQSDILSLHCPLTPKTHHLIDAAAIAAMKPGVMIINTGRGGLVDTRAVIDGLKSRKIGALGLDVYEGEGGLFFEDLSGEVIEDDVFMRLLTFPNVLITGHQAFFTMEALRNIAKTTLGNVQTLAQGQTCANEVKASS